MALVEPSRFVPAADGYAPVPDWKRADRACDVLPAGDPARKGGDPAREGGDGPPRGSTRAHPA